MSIELEETGPDAEVYIKRSYMHHLMQGKIPSLPEVIQVLVCVSFCEKLASYPVKEVWVRLCREMEREQIEVLEKGTEIKNKPGRTKISSTIITATLRNIWDS